jgi:AraC-like DNA-binding protein
MMIHRAPRPALRPFVKALWATDGARTSYASRERVLPTGTMHLVFRLSERPLRLYDGDRDDVGHTVGTAIVGGARTGFYVRDISDPSPTVGMQFHAGAAELILGVPADELAERHTRLEDLWGKEALFARERLIEERDLHRRLDLFEAIVATRLPRVRGVHPAVVHAIQRFADLETEVSDVVKESGYCHRRFIALFKQAVGLTPKVYSRVVRFQRLIELASDASSSWVDLAMEGGYSDQPHLIREFREIAGLSPRRYRELSPAQPNHVPLEVKNVQDRAARGRAESSP